MIRIYIGDVGLDDNESHLHIVHRTVLRISTLCGYAAFQHIMLEISTECAEEQQMSLWISL